EQTENTDLAARFAPLAKALTENEAQIIQELADAQGQPADLGGYYHPDMAKVDAVMRPSKTLNDALASL
ncbi:NADP-dependent isocitrate dehydrogenase, partial [Oceanospirillum beijerinckii]